MAINKVEYIKDSSIAGFAIAGEEITINESSASTIKTDADAGNTEQLTSAQTKFLNSVLPQQNDNTEYETDPTDNPEVAEGEEIPEGEEGKDNSKKSGDAGVSEAVGTQLAFGAATLGAVTACKVAMNSFTAPIVGGVALALAAGAVVNAETFDSEYKNRLTELANSQEYIETMSTYIDTLNADIISYNPEGSEGTEDENGDIPATPPPEKVDAETLKAHNDEAHSVKDFIINPTTKLLQGKMMGMLGAQNAAALTGCTVASIVLAVKAWMGVTLFTAPGAIVGAALCTAAALAFGHSAGRMMSKTVDEFKCGKKGDEIVSNLTKLNPEIQKHDELVAQFGPKDKSDGENPTTKTPDSTTTTDYTSTTTTTTASGDTGTTSTTGSTGNSTTTA